MTLNVTPAPGLLFVRRIETEDTYRGSPIIIPEASRDKLAGQQWEVVSVGMCEVCDDEDCERPHVVVFPDGIAIDRAKQGHPCDLKSGDWVLARKRAEAVTPDPTIYAIRQDDILGRFEER